MSTLRILRGTSVSWAAKDPILDAGQQGYETDTKRMRIGDGVTRWTGLEAFLPESDIQALIDEALAGLGGGTVTDEALLLHINSPTPHPVYDDGPSLVLLYQNAKV